MGRTIDEASLHRRAFVETVRPIAQANRVDRYLEAIRPRRIDALLAFVRAESVRARRSGDGRRVAWALRRLERLGYTFPECEIAVPPRRSTLDERRAA